MKTKQQQQQQNPSVFAASTLGNGEFTYALVPHTRYSSQLRRSVQSSEMICVGEIPTHGNALPTDSGA